MEQRNERHVSCIIELQGLLGDISNSNFSDVICQIEKMGWNCPSRFHSLLCIILKMIKYRSESIPLYVDAIIQIMPEDKVISGRLVLKVIFNEMIHRKIVVIPTYLYFLYLCTIKGVVSTHDVITKFSKWWINHAERRVFLWMFFLWFGPDMDLSTFNLFKLLDFKDKRIISTSLFVKDFIKLNEMHISQSYNWSSIIELRNQKMDTDRIFYYLKYDMMEDLVSLLNHYPRYNLQTTYPSSVFCPHPVLQYNPSLVDIAAYFGSNRCLRFLLINKVKINVADNYGRNTLDFAICGGNIDGYNICKQFGASSINELHNAALFYRKDFLQTFMLDYPNDPDLDAEYPELFSAAKSGFIECLDIMISSGCDIRSISKNGMNLVHYAASKGNSSILFYIWSRISDSIDLKDTKGVFLYFIEHQLCMRQKREDSQHFICYFLVKKLILIILMQIMFLCCFY